MVKNADKEAQWKTRVDEWEKSRLSEREYCNRHGYSVSALLYWIKHFYPSAPTRSDPLSELERLKDENVELRDTLAVMEELKTLRAENERLRQAATKPQNVRPPTGNGTTPLHSRDSSDTPSLPSTQKDDSSRPTRNDRMTKATKWALWLCGFGYFFYELGALPIAAVITSLHALVSHESDTHTEWNRGWAIFALIVSVVDLLLYLRFYGHLKL